MPADTERLAGWSANDDIRLWKWGFRRQRDLLAITFEISPVSFTSISVLLVTKSLKSLSLETERQPAATGEQIQHSNFSFWFWPEQRIDSFDEFHLQRSCIISETSVLGA